MSYLAMFREDAERRNAAVKAIKRAAKHSAYAERERIRKAKWRREHLDHNAAYLREWKKRTGFDNAAYLREWHKNHPGKQAEYYRRYKLKFISPIAGRAVSAETAKATDANLRPEVTR